MKRVLHIFILVLSILSLGLFLSISFYRWRYTDDFVFPTILEEKSVLAFAVDSYMNWDAKFLMPFCLLWFSGVKYLGFKVLMPLAALSFIGVSYCIVKIICDINKYKLKISEMIVLVAVINSFVFIILYHSISNLLYWMSGSVYVHSMFFGLLWLIWYNKVSKFSILFFLFTFFISTMPQNISLGLSMIIFIDLINNNPKKKYFQLFSIFVFGTIVSTFSPGSFKQLQLMQSESYQIINNSNGIKDYLFHLIKIYIDALSINYSIIILFTFLTFLIIRAFSKRPVKELKLTLGEFNFSFLKTNIKSILKTYKYFFASFFCLAVYWPTLLYGYRYYYGFYIFLFFALVLIYDKRGFFENEFKLNWLLNIFIGGSLIIGIMMYYVTLKEGLLIYRFVDKREKLLEVNRGKSYLELPSIDFNTFTRSVRTTDLNENPNFVTNKYYSKYYDIDTVVAKKLYTKQELQNNE